MEAREESAAELIEMLQHKVAEKVGRRSAVKEFNKIR